MAIWHDVYLFDATACIDALGPRVQSLVTDPHAYTEVRQAALALLHESVKVRHMVERYGGWDLQSIVTDFPAESAGSPGDVAFWLMVFVYQALESHPDGLGLGLSFRPLENALARSGWAKAETDLLIFGRSFEFLFGFAASNYRDVGARDNASFLKQLRPASQSGWAGWIGTQDLLSLKTRLEETSTRIERPIESVDVSQAFESAFRFVSAGLAERLSVCVIISG